MFFVKNEKHFLPKSVRQNSGNKFDDRTFLKNKHYLLFFYLQRWVGEGHQLGKRITG